MLAPHMGLRAARRMNPFVADLSRLRQRHTLYIEFADGAQWQYEGVPPMIYEGLMTAPSVGKFFAS
jgi:hypothetical protein